MAEQSFETVVWGLLLALAEDVADTGGRVVLANYANAARNGGSMVGVGVPLSKVNIDRAWNSDTRHRLVRYGLPLWREAQDGEPGTANSGAPGVHETLINYMTRFRAAAVSAAVVKLGVLLATEPQVRNFVGGAAAAGQAFHLELESAGVPVRRICDNLYDANAGRLVYDRVISDIDIAHLAEKHGRRDLRCGMCGRRKLGF